MCIKFSYDAKIACSFLNNFLSPSDVQNMPMKFNHYIYLIYCNNLLMDKGGGGDV